MNIEFPLTIPSINKWRWGYYVPDICQKDSKSLFLTDGEESDCFKSIDPHANHMRWAEV